MTAEDLGRRLLGEVEECGLDEILNSLRLQDGSIIEYFGLPLLDAMLQCVLEARTSSANVPITTPMVEITSRFPGSGKTHLLYNLVALAVLPSRYGGRQSAVVIMDTDGGFCVSRLAKQIRKLITDHTRGGTVNEEELDQVILDSLKHVHVLHPQTLASTVALLHALPDYLFNATRHYSFDRAVGFIALDAASTFYWQSRSDAEDAALQASISDSKVAAPSKPTGYTQLAAALKNASRILAAPIFFTSWDLNPPKSAATAAGFGPDAQSVRPSLPPPWQTLPTLRLIVQRAPVRKLPAEITVEDALRETMQRQQVVDQGRFECFVNEWGVDERTMQKLRSKGAGFDFFITEEGVKIGDGPD